MHEFGREEDDHVVFWLDRFNVVAEFKLQFAAKKSLRLLKEVIDIGNLSCRCFLAPIIVMPLVIVAVFVRRQLHFDLGRVEWLDSK